MGRFLSDDTVEACNRIKSNLDDGINSKYTFDFDNYLQTKRGMVDVTYLSGKIAKWLHCSAQQAKTIVHETPSLKTCHLDSVEDYINFMKDNGMDMKLIVRNPWLLDHSLSTMRERITLLSEMGISPVTVHLLKLSTRNLTEAVQCWVLDRRSGKYDQNSNRLEFFSKHLDCTAEQLSVLVAKHCALLTRDFDSVSAVLFMLLNNGVTPEEIRNYLTVFKYSSEHVKKRVDAARLATVSLKPWMMLIGERKCAETLEKWRGTSCNELRRKRKDAMDILAEKLKCKRDYVVCMTKRCPQLQTMRPAPLIQKLDLIIEFGHTYEEICYSPIILTKSLSLIKNRFIELRKLQHRPSSLALLASESKDFELFVKRLRDKAPVSDTR